MIPAEAVEAAAKAMYDLHRYGPRSLEGFMDDARAALEAAAPHMMAAAWDEGFAVGWDCEGDVSDNPYREATRGDD